jgi:hypothetical protein
MTTREILLKAAQIVREPGMWRQKAASGPQDPTCCAMEAIEAAAGKKRVSSYEGSEAMTALGKLLGQGAYRSIIAWNDAEGRTAEEVAAAMEQAAESIP